MSWARFKNSSDWRFVGALVALMALLQLIGPEVLRYQRDWVETGQVWRILSAHCVHVGWVHWLLNSLGLVIMVTLTAPDWSISRWIATTAGIAVGISILMTLFNPEVRDLAGFSGVLYGLYLLGAIGLFARDRLIAVLVGAAIVIKILMEQFQFYDFNSGSLIGARVVVDSHLYGAITAIAIALLWSTYTMNHGTTEHTN
jgi:rhomboid family GlyGly-CTERM serine protease